MAKNNRTVDDIIKERNELLSKVTPAPSEGLEPLNKDMTSIYKNDKYRKNITDRHRRAVEIGKELGIGIRNESELQRYRGVADGTMPATGPLEKLNSPENRKKLKEWTDSFDFDDDKDYKDYSQSQYNYWQALGDGKDAMPNTGKTGRETGKTGNPPNSQNNPTTGGGQKTAPSAITPPIQSTATPGPKSTNPLLSLGATKSPFTNTEFIPKGTDSGGIASQPHELAMENNILVDKTAKEAEHRQKYNIAKEIDGYTPNAKQAFQAGISRKDIEITTEQDGKQYLNINKPDEGLRHYQSEWSSWLIKELNERQKAGYYKDITARDVLDHVGDGMVDRAWGKIFNQGGSKFVDDMRSQHPELADLYDSKIDLMKDLSGQQTRKISVDELTKLSATPKDAHEVATDVKRRVQSGLLSGITHLAGLGVDMLTPDSVSDTIGEDVARGLDNLLSLSSTIDPLNPVSSYYSKDDVMNSLFASYKQGKLVGIMDKPELLDKIKPYLSEEQQNLFDSAVPHVREILYNTSEMVGSLLPMGSMSEGFKIGRTLARSPKTLPIAMSRSEEIAKTFVQDGIKRFGRGGFRDFIAKNGDIIQEGLATKEGIKTQNLWKALTKQATGDLSFGEGAVQDIVGFTLNAAANDYNFNGDDLKHSMATGLVFRGVNDVLGRAFGSMAARYALMRSKIDPAAADLLLPELSRKIQGAALWSNLAANPIQSYAGNLLEQYNQTGELDFRKAYSGWQVANDVFVGLGFLGHGKFNSGKHYNPQVMNEVKQVYDKFSKEHREAVNEEPASFISRFINAHKDLDEVFDSADKRKQMFPAPEFTNKPKEEVQPEVKTKVVMPDDMNEALEYGDVPVGSIREDKTPIEDMRGNPYVQDTKMPPWLDKDLRGPVDDVQAMLDMYEIDTRKGSPTTDTPVTPTPSIGETVNQMYKDVNGKDIDENTTAHDLARVLMVNSDLGNEAIRKALVTMTKGLPATTKVKIGEAADKNGIALGGYYHDNTIHFGTNNQHGTPDMAIATMVEESMHASVENYLQNNPTITDNIRSVMDTMRNHMEEEGNQFENSLDENVKEAYYNFKDNDWLKEYYLNDVSEFAAGMLNPNTGLHKLAKEMKLPNQKTNKLYDKVMDALWTKGERTVIDDYYKHMDTLLKGEGGTSDGVLGMPLDKLSKDELENELFYIDDDISMYENKLNDAERQRITQSSSDEQQYVEDVGRKQISDGLYQHYSKYYGREDNTTAMHVIDNLPINEIEKLTGAKNIKNATVQRDEQTGKNYINYVGHIPVTKEYLSQRNILTDNEINERLQKLYQQKKEYQDAINSKSDNNILGMPIDYQLKALDILQSDKAESIFKKGIKNNWGLDKILNELSVPKEQKKLILSLNKNDREDIINDMLAKYSYTIEINTAKENKVNQTGNINKQEWDNRVEELANQGLSIEERRSILEKEFNTSSIPTQYYSNLTVPGGTNYTEKEIATPAITPSIKGHAQFSTDKGIGWFRSDDKIDTKTGSKTISEYRIGTTEDVIAGLIEPEEVGKDVKIIKNNDLGTTESKTRRILEVQSDLFQKGRDKQDLTSTEKSWDFNNRETKEQEDNRRNGNKFLQLLNKENNWVTFFIKSIVQDSVKKGYEKVLFPTGNTASKVEGHTTLEEFKKQKEDRIKQLEQDRITIENYSQKEINHLRNNLFYSDSVTDEKIKEEALEQNNNEINQLKIELERVETEGFGALRPIYNFYENTVTNILKKQGYNPTVITDEYGNTWNEVSIKSNHDNKILLGMPLAQREQQIKGYEEHAVDNLYEHAKEHGESDYIKGITKDKATPSDVMKIMGTSDRSAMFKRLFAKNDDGSLNAEETMKKAISQLDRYSKKVELSPDDYAVHKSALEAFVQGEVLKHNNDVEIKPLSIKQFGDKIIVEEFKSNNEQAEEARTKKASRAIANIRGDGRPVQFQKGKMDGLIKSINNLYEKGRDLHTNKFMSDVLSNMKDPKQADIQKFETIDEEQNSTTGITIPYDNPKDLAELNKQLIVQSGYYMFPHGSKGQIMVDTGLRGKIDWDGNNPIAIQPEKLAKETDNWLFHHWLSSYEGGNKKQLSDKYGRITDIEKMLTANPQEILGEPDIHKAMARVVSEDIINDPAKNQLVVKMTKEGGYNQKELAELVQDAKKFYSHPITGDLLALNHERNADDKPAMVFEALNKIYHYVTDPGGKDLVKIGKQVFEDGEGYTKYKLGKYSNKYIGVLGQAKKVKDESALKVILGEKYKDGFTPNNVDYWRDKGIKIDKDGNYHNESVIFSAEDMEAMNEQYPIIAKVFQDAATDGSTIILNDKWHEVLSDIFGKDNLGSLKTSSHYADADFSQIFKSALHKPESVNTLGDAEVEQMYKPLLRLFDSLRSQGISEIVFSSGVKSSTTRRLKQAKAAIPGKEDVDITYDGKGRVIGKVTTGEDAVKDDTDYHNEALQFVLAGGTVPEYMKARKYLTGPHGINFISAPEADGSNHKLPIGIMNLPVMMPGHPYHDANMPLVMNAIKNINNETAQAYRGFNLLQKYSKYYDFENKVTPKDYTKEDAIAIGTFLEKAHTSVKSNLNNDSPEARLFNRNSEILNVLEHSYVKDANGVPTVNEEGIGAVFMYPNLFIQTPSTEAGKPNTGKTIAQSVMSNIWEDAVMYRVPGKSGTLNPVLMPLLHIKLGADAKAKKIIADKNLSKETKEKALASLYTEMDALKNEHLDEHGYFNKDSRGVVVGQNIIDEMNANGRRKFGDKWNDVEVGHKMFVTLNPADSASSMTPVKIIGTSNTTNFIGGNPVIFKNMGRDFDADTVGLIPDSPMWHDENGVSSHEQFWDNCDAMGVGFSDADRIYKGIPQDKLTEMGSLFKGGTSMLAKHLGVPDNLDGIVPQQGISNYINQQSANSDIGGSIAKINKYVADTQNKGYVYDVDNLDDYAGYTSFAKQYGVVDKFTVATAQVTNKYDGKIAPTVKVPEQSITKSSIESIAPNPIPSPQNDLANKIGKVKNQPFVTPENKIKDVREIVAKRIKVEDVPYAKEADNIIRKITKPDNNYPFYHVTKEDYAKASNVEKPVLLQLAGLSILNAHRKPFIGTDTIFQSVNKGKMYWQAIDGEPHIVVQKTATQTQKYTIDDAYNADGTFTKEFSDALQSIGAPDYVMMPTKDNIKSDGYSKPSLFADNLKVEGEAKTMVNPTGGVKFRADNMRLTTTGKALGVLATHAAKESGESKEIIAGNLLLNRSKILSQSHWSNLVAGMRDVGVNPIVKVGDATMTFEQYVNNTANKIVRDHYTKPDGIVRGAPAIDLMKSLSMDPERVRKGIERITGKNIATMDSPEYEKWYNDAVVPEVTKRMGGKLTSEQLDMVLEALSPATFERLNAIGADTKYKIAYTHLALRMGTDLMYSNRNWSPFALHNPFSRNSDEMLVSKASSDKIALKPDDVVYNGYKVQNGNVVGIVPVLQNNLVDRATQWHNVGTFTSANSIKYVNPHTHLEGIKAVADSELMEFASRNINLDKAEEMLREGKLDNLPEVNIQTGYDSMSSRKTGTVTVNGTICTDDLGIREAVAQHYGNDKDMVDVVSGLISAKQQAHHAADKLLVFAQNYERLAGMISNPDNQMLALSRAAEIKDEVQSIVGGDLKGVLSLVREPMSTGRALENILPLTDRNSNEYLGLFNEQKQLNNRELLFRVGQKLFGYEGGYSEGLVKKRGGLYETPEMKKVIDGVQKAIKGVYAKHDDYGKDTVSIVNSFATASKVEGEPSAYNTRLGDIVMALRDVVNERSAEQGKEVDNDKWSDIEHNTQQLSNYLQQQFKRHLIGNSHVGLASYFENPDGSGIAHDAMSSIFSRAFGTERNYNIKISVPDLIEEVRTGLTQSKTGMYKGDTKQLVLGQMVTGLATRGDGEQTVFKGRYLGSSLPDKLVKAINPNTYEYETYKQRGTDAYIHLYDEDTHRTHLIDVGAIRNLMSSTVHGILNRRVDNMEAKRVLAANIVDTIHEKFKIGEHEELGTKTAHLPKQAIRVATDRIEDLSTRQKLEKMLIGMSRSNTSQMMYLGGNYKLKAMTDIGLIGAGTAMLGMGNPIGAVIAAKSAMHLGYTSALQVVKQLATVIGNGMGGRADQMTNYKVLPSFSPGGEGNGTVDPHTQQLLARSGQTGFFSNLKETEGINEASNRRTEMIKQTVFMANMEAKLQDIYEKEYGGSKMKGSTPKTIIGDAVRKSNNKIESEQAYEKSFTKYLAEKHPEVLEDIKDDYLITHNGEVVSLESAKGDTKGKTFGQIRKQFLSNVEELSWGILDTENSIMKYAAKGLINLMHLNSKMTDVLTTSYGSSEVIGAQRAIEGGYKNYDNWASKHGIEGNSVTRQNFAESQKLINNGDYSTNYMGGTLFAKATGTFVQFNKEMKLQQTTDYRKAQNFYNDVQKQLIDLGLGDFVEENNKMFGLKGSLVAGELPITNRKRSMLNQMPLALATGSAIAMLVYGLQAFVTAVAPEKDKEKYGELGELLGQAISVPDQNDMQFINRVSGVTSVPADATNHLAALVLANLSPNGKTNIMSAEKKQLAKLEEPADVVNSVGSFSPAHRALIEATFTGMNVVAAYYQWFNTDKQLAEQFKVHLNGYVEKTKRANESALFQANVNLAKTGMGGMSFIPGMQELNIIGQTIDDNLSITKRKRTDIRNGK